MTGDPVGLRWLAAMERAMASGDYTYAEDMRAWAEESAADAELRAEVRAAVADAQAAGELGRVRVLSALLQRADEGPIAWREQARGLLAEGRGVGSEG